MLLSIAALTSTISLLEVAVSYMVDERKIQRKVAVWIVGFLTFLLGIPSALSQGAVGALSHLSFLGGKSYLDIMDFIWGNLSLVLGAFLLSIFVGWVWGADKAIAEMNSGAGVLGRQIGCLPITYGQIWAFFIRFLVPPVILIIMLFKVF